MNKEHGKRRANDDNDNLFDYGVDCSR